VERPGNRAESVMQEKAIRQVHLRCEWHLFTVGFNLEKHIVIDAVA
jgi:hypothetical protein